MTGYYFIAALIFFAWVSSMWSSTGAYNIAIKTFGMVMLVWSMFEAAQHFGYVVKV